MSLLLPTLDDDSRPFWEGCASGELKVQRCGECGLARFPPRPMCPRCQSLESAWKVASGRGAVWSYVVVHPPLLSAYREMAPYNVIVVELADFPVRMVGNLVLSADGAIGEIDPATMAIGTPVSVVFATVGDDADGQTIALPRWVPMAEQ